MSGDTLVFVAMVGALVGIALAVLKVVGRLLLAAIHRGCLLITGQPLYWLHSGKAEREARAAAERFADAMKWPEVDREERVSKMAECCDQAIRSYLYNFPTERVG